MNPLKSHFFQLLTKLFLYKDKFVFHILINVDWVLCLLMSSSSIKKVGQNFLVQNGKQGT